MDLHELLGTSGHKTYLVLYRISADAMGSADERRGLLTQELARFNGEGRGRFFDEAGHLSTSAWSVRVRSETTAGQLVQHLKQEARLSAHVDYLWAIEIAEPVNESHITREPRDRDPA